MRGLFWLLSAVALGGFLLAAAGTSAQAECMQCITAYFEGDAGTVDTYPGIAGGGWAGPWTTAEFHGTATATLTNAAPVVDSGNYLRLNLDELGTADKARGSVSRDFGYDAANNPCGIDLEEKHCVCWKMRFADYNASSFSDVNDSAYVCDNDEVEGVSGNSSWSVYARGDMQTGGVHYWSMLATNDGGTSFAWFATDVSVQADEVVTCCVEVDPENSTWDLLISDSTDSWDSRTDLPTGYEPMYWPGQSGGPGGFFFVGARTQTSQEERTMEVDSVVICQPCIPEPSTLILLTSLALFGLSIRRK